MVPVISNATARRLFLDRHALAEPPTGLATGEALARLIDRIGFVQIDSINTVGRAHHMILWSRRRGYRPEALKRAAEVDRALFEHVTHDASFLPIALFPHWRHRFARDRERLVDRWTGWQRDGFHEKFDDVLKHVADHGPVSSSDVGEGERRGSGGWWDWHPSKAALEYLWRVGEISVLRRDGFRKVYDLTERVIPPEFLNARTSVEQTEEALCAIAMDRLGLATPGEIAAYWAAVPPEAARRWAMRELAEGRLVEADVEGADGRLKRAFLRPGTLDAPVPEPPGTLRILSPFDPALRDRKRAERLFGFCYRIEVFVPEPKRQYGYYVFPVLQGARIVGRIDAKAHRDAGALRVRAFWPEAGIRTGKDRRAALDAELDRLARFSGCDRVEYAPDWLRG
ncbi:winged helix-turn-helix domain-containing protein [Aliigemmobacter aestuarii]|uniref:Winged helix-turn-helix domain-containing protein n=1 Tax=Aliigemmobacter aestuarii TaxID=1445661 RepID=A0A4S3MT62_9RHOB|nr:crosslink repair DNA glycosylase YcaQ family protein [Gemmobacter aestuarii]THD85344.1 winged helix-turn-helix domain-containing protein [Gemmobacter aestuarii]